MATLGQPLLLFFFFCIEETMRCRVFAVMRFAQLSSSFSPTVPSTTPQTVHLAAYSTIPLAPTILSEDLVISVFRKPLRSEHEAILFCQSTITLCMPKQAHSAQDALAPQKTRVMQVSTSKMTRGSI